MDPRSWTLPPAIYLRATQYGLRAPERADAHVVETWWGETPVPSPEMAEVLLERDERVPWGRNPVTRLMIVDLAPGEVVGSIVITRRSDATGTLALMVGAGVLDAGAVEREVLGLVVPWLLEEIRLRALQVKVAADESSRIAALEAAGMRPAVRLREHRLRPHGRVDVLVYERVNARWGRRWEGRGDA